MFVTRGADAPTFDLPGVRFTPLAAPTLGSADLCLWRLDVDPGLESPEAHVLDQDEIFVVVAGTISLSIGGMRLTAGDAAIIPAGEPIQLSNPGSEPATVHVAIRSGFAATAADGTSIGTPPWAA